MNIQDQQCPGKRYKQLADQFINLSSKKGNTVTKFELTLKQQLQNRLSQQNIQQGITKLLKGKFININVIISQKQALQMFNYVTKNAVTSDQDNHSAHVFSTKGYSLLLQAIDQNNYALLQQALQPTQLKGFVQKGKFIYKFGKYFFTPQTLKKCAQFIRKQNGIETYDYPQIRGLSFTIDVDGKFKFWQKINGKLVLLTSKQVVDNFLYRLVKGHIQQQNKKVLNTYYQQKKCLTSCQKTAQSQQRKFLQNILGNIK